MTKFRLAIFLAMACAMALPATGQAQEKPATRTEVVDGTLKSGLHVELHTPDTIQMGRNGEKNSVRSMLAGNPESHWLFLYSSDNNDAYENGDDYVTLLVKLKDLVLITGVTLRLCRGSAGVGYVSPKEIYVQTEMSSVPGFPSESFYPLSKDKAVQAIKLPAYSRYTWANLLPTRRVIIHVTNVYGKNKKSAIGCLAGIDLSYTQTNTMSYTPKYSWEVLKKLILVHAHRDKNGKWDSPAMANRQVRYELMYYVVKGNKEARKLFDEYKPINVFDSEYLDATWRPAVNELFGHLDKR